MTILFTAMALAAAPAQSSAQPPVPAPHAMHAQHSQHKQATKPAVKASGDGCSCCKDMGGGGKMACCAKHGEGDGAEHSGHKANR